MNELLNQSEARTELRGTFYDTPFVYGRVNELTDKQIQVLHALVNGYSLSNVGYDVKAQIEVTRLDATIGHLRRDHGFPITETRVETYSESGKPVKRSRYTIERCDLELMHTNPVASYDAVKKDCAIKQKIHENHDIKRLIETYGEAGAMRRLFNQAYKPVNLTNSQKKAINESIEQACALGDIAKAND